MPCSSSDLLNAAGAGADAVLLPAATELAGLAFVAGVEFVAEVFDGEFETPAPHPVCKVAAIKKGAMVKKDKFLIIK